jgi:hypothetical protein
LAIDPLAWSAQSALLTFCTVYQAVGEIVPPPALCW